MINSKNIKIDNNIHKIIEKELPDDESLLQSILNENFKTTDKWVVAKSFEPIYDKNSKIMFVGTIPSAAGRKNGFYYTSDVNHFWELLNYSFSNGSNDKPVFDKTDIKGLRKELLKRGIAITDTIKTCIRKPGSLDNAILLYQQNDEIVDIVNKSDIDTIFCTSDEAKKYLKDILGISRYTKNHLCKFDNKQIYIDGLTSPSGAKWMNLSEAQKQIVREEWKKAINSRI